MRAIIALVFVLLATCAQAQPIGDAKIITDAAISSGQATLSSATAGFSGSDVGKVINVAGAGASGSPLITTISAVSSSTQVTLASTGSTNVTGAKAWFGTDDTAKLQGQLDAGGVVVVPAGLYLLTATLQMPSGSVLRGEGHASWLIWADVPLDTSRRVGIRESASGNTDMRIEDLTVDIEPLGTLSGGHQPIRFERTERTKVLRNRVRSNGQGILHVASSHYVVAHNLLELTRANVSGAGDGGIDQWDGSHDGVIEGNIIEGNNALLYAILASGIASGSQSSSPVYNLVISGNIIKNARQVGIQLQGEFASTDVHDITLTGNVIDGVSGNGTEGIGIKLRNCNSVVVSGNKIKNTGEQGISTGGTYGCDNVAIDGNIVEGSNQKQTTNNVAGAAIALVTGTSNCIVSNNRIHGVTHYRGIRLVTGSVNNIVAGNLSDPSVASPTILNDGTNNHIVDNW